MSFKPCYKWNTFNTVIVELMLKPFKGVLNLVISGIPSIPAGVDYSDEIAYSFKPCYKWNTFNTYVEV